MLLLRANGADFLVSCGQAVVISVKWLNYFNLGRTPMEIPRDLTAYSLMTCEGG